MDRCDLGGWMDRGCNIYVGGVGGWMDRWTGVIWVV